MIVSNKEQYEKLVAAGEIPTLEHVVVLDEGEFDGRGEFGRDDRRRRGVGGARMRGLTRC